jgi:hypothetical protein
MPPHYCLNSAPILASFPAEVLKHAPLEAIRKLLGKRQSMSQSNTNQTPTPPPVSAQGATPAPVITDYASL